MKKETKTYEILRECKRHTPIEEMQMNIEFTKEHIEVIKAGGDIKWGDNIVMSKVMYLEGAYKFLKNQEEELNRLEDL